MTDNNTEKATEMVEENAITPFKWKDSLGAKLLKKVFSYHVIVAVTVTVAHMASEFYREKDGIHQELANIEQTFNLSLQYAVWTLDFEQVNRIVNGIILLHSVEGVKIEDNKGKMIKTSGAATVNQADITRKKKSIKDAVTKVYKHSFYLYDNASNKQLNIGKVTLYSSSNVVVDRVKVNFLFIVVNAIIKTIALWLLVVWLTFMLRVAVTC